MLGLKTVEIEDNQCDCCSLTKFLSFELPFWNSFKKVKVFPDRYKFATDRCWSADQLLKNTGLFAQTGL
jgi:hypothetical protein